jgi:cathepsin L
VPRMQRLLLVVAIATGALAALSEREYQTLFTTWARQHGKSYAHDAFLIKYNTFKANHQFVESWNARVAAGEDLHTVEVNKFADLTLAEFSRFYLGTKVTADTPRKETSDPAVDALTALPTTVDWRTKGAVTPVKDQGQCGSCWAFSTTGSVEGCHFLTTQKLVGLSEENLVDCSDAEGNEGCNGGLMTQAMEYIMKNKGLDTEASYPYTAGKGQAGKCKYETTNIGTTLTKYQNVKAHNETDLAVNVVLAPTSVAIDASQSSFQFYKSGIYSDPDCSSSQLDHGVLAVGYGVLNSKDYWIVKNSWNSDWGLKGYIWMAKDKHNMCGIATMATRPTGPCS